jgi:hypothetical protein
VANVPGPRDETRPTMTTPLRNPLPADERMTMTTTIGPAHAPGGTTTTTIGPEAAVGAMTMTTIGPENALGATTMI